MNVDDVKWTLVIEFRIELINVAKRGSSNRVSIIIAKTKNK